VRISEPPASLFPQRDAGKRRTERRLTACELAAAAALEGRRFSWRRASGLTV
jgi:hypothetical protein